MSDDTMDRYLAIAASADLAQVEEALDDLLTTTTERDLTDVEEEFMHFAAAVIVGKAMVDRGVPADVVERMFLADVEGGIPKEFAVDFKRDANGALSITINFTDGTEVSQ